MKKWRELVILLMVIAAAATVGHFHHRRTTFSLVGTWRVDVDKTMASIKETEVYRVQSKLKKTADWELKLRKTLDVTTSSFTDSKWSMRVDGQTETKSYRVVSSEGGKSTFEWTIEVDTVPKQTGLVTWTDNDHFGLRLPEHTRKAMEFTFYFIRQ